jgi:hypothetical protein
VHTSSVQLDSVVVEGAMAPQPVGETVMVEHHLPSESQVEVVVALHSIGGARVILLLVEVEVGVGEEVEETAAGVVLAGHPP